MTEVEIICSSWIIEQTPPPTLVTPSTSAAGTPSPIPKNTLAPYLSLLNDIDDCFSVGYSSISEEKYYLGNLGSVFQ